MLRPMVDFTFKTDINYIEVVEPNIPGNLVSAIPPDIFLFIKCGLIRRKVFQMDLGMLAKKKSDFFSLMPFSPINKEVDDITSKSFQHMLQNLYKSLLVTSGSAYQPFTPHKGATQPDRFSRSRCWLVVETLSLLPFLAQPRPNRGCKLKPVSS